MKRFLAVFILLYTFSAPLAFAQKIMSNCNASGDQRIVPNVLGLTAKDAKNIVEACDLVWSYSDHPQTMSYEAIGTIGAQEPKGGLIVGKGTAIRGFLSKGFFLPNFIGSQASQAADFATDLRLGTSILTKRDSAPAGEVIDQNHKNGIFFNSGLALILTVSEGPWVIVPDLSGIEFRKAKNQLENLNLRPQHAGGPLEYSHTQLTICEYEHRYPIIAEHKPFHGVKVFEGAPVALKTETRRDIIDVDPPAGQVCP